MPYEGQQASKRGHIDIVKNDDVIKFLSECAYLTQPGEQAARALTALYQQAPMCVELPQLVVASDGSAYSEPIDKEFPSTQIGYVKTSFMAFDMGDFNGLVKPGSPFVDPFAAASLHNKARAVAFTLPGTNVRYKGLQVQDGFRLSVYEQLSDERTQIPKGGFSVKDILYHLEGGKFPWKNVLRVARLALTCSRRALTRASVLLARPSCMLPIHFVSTNKYLTMAIILRRSHVS